ncbi:MULTISPECIES: hypothetical protein [unclassified Methanosarcina]|nr:MULTISPECIES: hypothetical protein [unclassified Methanosarcina]
MPCENLKWNLAVRRKGIENDSVGQRYKKGKFASRKNDGLV